MSSEFVLCTTMALVLGSFALRVTHWILVSGDSSVFTEFTFSFASIFLFSPFLLSFYAAFFRWHSFFSTVFSHLSSPRVCELIHLIFISWYFSLPGPLLPSFTLSQIWRVKRFQFSAQSRRRHTHKFFLCVCARDCMRVGALCWMIHNVRCVCNMCSRILSFSLLYPQFTIHIVILWFLFFTKVIM